MTYRPNEIVVGYYDTTVNGSKVRGGFPSCRWLKENSYTEVSAFSRLTGGIKPHMQRDSEKQISKDLGVTAGVFTNDFIDGFKLVSLSPHVILLDPRGFYVQLSYIWLNDILINSHCSISSDGIVSGKFAYLFSNKYFNSLVHEDNIEIIDIDDDAIDAINKNVEHFKLKDLEVGTVYEAYDKGKVKTQTSRYLYIGEHSMHSLKVLHRYLTSLSANTHLDTYSHIYQNSQQDFPWNNKECIALTEALDKSFKKWPVFIELKDNISYLYGKRKKEWQYCDFIAGGVYDEHSIRFSLIDSSIIQGTELIKRITKKSSCQDIRMDDWTVGYKRKSWTGLPQCYMSPSEYKTFPLDMVTAGFKSFLNNIESTLKERRELSPVMQPEHISEWEWKVKEYKDKCRKNGMTYALEWC